MIESKQDYVEIIFSIESQELTSAYLTQKFGMLPDKVRTKGNAKATPGKYWNAHAWIVETRLNSNDHEGMSAQDLLPKAMELFAARTGALAKMAAGLGAAAESIVVLCINTDVIPGLEFSHSFLKLLADFDATFEIDIMQWNTRNE